MSEEGVKDPLALESQICFALSLASRRVITAYRPVLEPLHLTHSQYLVMLTLWQQAPMSNKALSEALHLDPATLSPLVKRLEGIGYLNRTRLKSDERSFSITLTQEGKDLRDQAQKIPGIMMKKFNMSEEELLALHSSMMKLITAAEESVKAST